jgi:tetratricopeptide (TPR) repeat protein
MCARLNALGFNYLFGVHQVISSAVLRGFVEKRVHHSLEQILMTLPVVLLDYMAVLVVPWMAGPTHAISWITHPQPLLFICAAALLLISTAAFVAAWRNSDRRIYLFCAIWSVVTIAPALNLNALWYLVDDRYLYAPSFGLCLAVAVALMRIAAASSNARKAVAAACGIFLAASVISMIQTEHYWHDDVTFFTRCIEIDPSVADYRLKLAASLNQAGQPEAAARTYESAISLAPDDAHMHLMLARQYQTMGREMDFEREFQKFNELSSAKIMRQRAAEASGASQPADSP